MTDSYATDGGAATASEEHGTSVRTFRIAGAILAALGVLAILFPFVAGVSASLLLGAALIAGGVVQAVHAARASGWNGFLGLGLLAIVYVIAGLALVLNPVLGLASLTLLVIAYLLVSGAAETLLGLQIRGEANWGWVVFSGVLSVLLGLLLLAGFPGTAVWALGLLLGINLLATGVSMVMVGRGMRSETAVGDADTGAMG